MADEISKLVNKTDCDWLALRYVGDEMTASERTEFESLLAESQEAREAVAAAVLMFAAVPLALSDSASANAALPAKPVRLPVGRPWLRRAGWSAVGWSAIGAAACLAAVLGVESFRHFHSAPVSRAIVTGAKDQGTQAMGELAQHWTSLADADALGSESNADADDAETASDDLASADTVANRDAKDSIDELAAPSWLLAAVAPPAGPPAQTPPASE